MMETLLVVATRFLVGGHGRWVGCRPSLRQRIYFANHGSHLDTIVLWAALPSAHRPCVHPVAAADYWDRDRVRRYVGLTLLGSVLVDRGGGQPGEALKPLHAALDDGRSLILFPEGTRRPDRLPGPFKSGLYHLAAAHPAVELIPVYLENLSRAFPKGALIPAPIACTARFGGPVVLDRGEPKDAFLARARDAVAALAA